jgi:transposase InsO family protein
MLIRLHKNATTTPAIRTEIQASGEPVAVLAARYGVSQSAIRRWRGRRGEVHDRSHVRHHLGQSTDPTEEALISELRTQLGLSLDDITEVMRRCVNAKLSRSAIHRCLVRLGLSKRLGQGDVPAPGGRFETTGIGFLHIDLKHLPALRRQKAYAYVAIDRATRFVFLEVHAKRDAKTAAGFLERLHQAFPVAIRVVLTDNGSEFTDRFAIDMKDKPKDKPSGRHAFDQVCARLNIQHRLARPFRPQTNGMVERFNRRLAEALRAHDNIHARRKFDTHHERNAFLAAVVENYNRTRLRCLGYKAPAEAITNLAGHNTFAGMSGF